jgi:predicted transposase YdaD
MVELDKNGNIEILEHDDLSTTILVCLGERSEEPTLTDLLEVALSNKIDPEEKIKILEEKYSIPMTIDLEEEVMNMCNLSQGIKEEGIEIGLERGLERGHEERTIISIENLMRTVNFSLEQAMYALDIPEADRAYYANVINGK